MVGIGLWDQSMQLGCRITMALKHYGKQSGSFPYVNALLDHQSIADNRKCTKNVYPFHDGKFEDFEPVFNNLIEVWGTFSAY